MRRKKTIGDVMSRKLICVHDEEHADQAAALMQRHEVRQLPVTRDGLLAGAVTELDLRVAQHLAFGKELKAGHVMDEVPLNVRPDTPLRDVLEAMYHFKHDYALITGEDNDVRGIFTRQDALRLLLEERPREAGVVHLRSNPLRIARAA
jgi:CBS domain-containing protein